MLFRMFIGCGITLFQQLSGQNCVLFYAPILFKVLGFSSNAGATMATIGVGAAKFVFSILNFVVIDTLGRRPLLMIGIFILSASTLLLGTLTIVYIDPYLVLSNSETELTDCSNLTLISQSEYTFPTNNTFPSSVQTSISATKWISLVLFMIYVGGYEISFGNIAWLLLTELFPPSVRGQAFSLCTTINWSMNLIVSITLLSIYHGILGYTYILFSAFCSIALVFVFFTVPETKKKSLEKISEELKNSKLCPKV